MPNEYPAVAWLIMIDDWRWKVYLSQLDAEKDAKWLANQVHPGKHIQIIPLCEQPMRIFRHA